MKTTVSSLFIYRSRYSILSVVLVEIKNFPEEVGKTFEKLSSLPRKAAPCFSESHLFQASIEAEPKKLQSLNPGIHDRLYDFFF